MKVGAIGLLPLGVLMFFTTNGLWELFGFHPRVATASLFVSLIFCAFGLYALREWSRLIYGIVELAIGAAIMLAALNAYGVAQNHEVGYIIGGGIFHKSPEGVLQLSGPQIALFGMLVAIYFLVRSFDNIGEGLRQRRTSRLIKVTVQSPPRIEHEADDEHTSGCAGGAGISSSTPGNGDGGRRDNHDGTTAADAHH
jgi:hypothetical protein